MGFAMIFVSVSAMTHGSTVVNKYIVFVAYVLGISFLNSASPLIYELLAEISHPVPEDIINGLCNQCNNLFGVLFYFTFSALSLPSQPGNREDNYTWLLYTLMIVPVFVTVFFTLVKEEYLRSEDTSNVNYSSNNSTVFEEQEIQ